MHPAFTERYDSSAPQPARVTMPGWAGAAPAGLVRPRPPPLAGASGSEGVELQAPQAALGHPHLHLLDALAHPDRAGGDPVVVLAGVGVGALRGVALRQLPVRPPVGAEGPHLDGAGVAALPLEAHQLGRVAGVGRAHPAPLGPAGGQRLDLVGDLGPEVAAGR